MGSESEISQQNMPLTVIVGIHQNTDFSNINNLYILTQHCFDLSKFTLLRLTSYA